MNSTALILSAPAEASEELSNISTLSGDAQETSDKIAEQIYDALYNRDFDAVQNLLSSEEVPVKSRNLALRISSLTDETELVQNLLKQGEITDDTLEWAIQQSARRGNLENVKAILAFSELSKAVRNRALVEAGWGSKMAAIDASLESPQNLKDWLTIQMKYCKIIQALYEPVYIPG